MPRVSLETLRRIDSAEMTWVFAEAKQCIGDLVKRPVHAVVDALQTRATAFRQGLQETRRNAAQYRTVKHVEKLLFADPPLSLLSVSFTLQDRRFHALPDEGKELILEAFAKRVLMDPQDEIERTLAENFLNKRTARRNNNMA